MVIDAITYNGEEELFDLRYNILKNHVNAFIVVEANETFSGKPKPFYFEKIKDKYKNILYLQVTDYPNDTILNAMAWNSETVPWGQVHWHREFYQKECIKKALANPSLNLKDDDFVFVGDCDEIWNPEILKLPFEVGVYKLKQLVYSYYLNQNTNEDWAGTYFTDYKTIRNGILNHLRTRYPWVLVENGGWHFTNMGGVENVIRKLESYGHQEYNTNEIKNAVAARMERGEDYIGRSFLMRIDESQWPQYLKDNRAKYAHMMR